MIDVVSRYGLDTSGTLDNAPKLAQMAADVALMFYAKRPLPRLVFTEGDIAFSAWPDLAYDNLQIVAEGECRLRPQGCSIVFDASLRNPISGQSGNTYQPQVENMLFDGFNVYASSTPTCVSFRGIHRSRLRLTVFGNGHVQNAIELMFCIITTLEPRVSSGGGVIVNAWPNKPALQTTACTIANPCLEGAAVGLLMASAGSCMVYGGTIESCGVGVALGAGAGNNVFYSVEMEGNGQDVNAASGAHGNGFMYCGNSGKLNTNFGIFSSNWARN